MIKKRRSVLMSLVTFMLCLALVAGGTYALFSDQVTLTTHLKAGTLDITLERTNLVARTLNSETGFLGYVSNSEIVDFSKPTDRNVFDIDYTDKIVPGCAYHATLKLTNNTDVAFMYWVEIINRADKDLALADQLKVSVKVGEGEKTSEILSDGLNVGSQAKPIGILAKSEAESFVVSLEFLDLAVNNAAKNQSLDFDVIVHAVQVVDAP